MPSPVLEPSGSLAEEDFNEDQPAATAQITLTARRKMRRSAWALLCQPSFRVYFLGALASNLGTWLQSTAQILIAYQITHSVFTVGLITSAQFAGMVLVSPWAAVLADRIGTKPLLIGTQGTSALIAVYMAWRYHSGLLGVHTLMLGALALGLAYALALPVQTALVPGLVDPADATGAVKMNSVAYNTGRALAPALCVLVIAIVGRDVIFLLNAASFIVFAVCLVAALGRLRSAHGKAVIVAPYAADEPASPRRARVTDGLLIALAQPRILLLLAIVAAVTLADDPILVLSPALAHTRLHLPSDWAGYFIAALGWGSVLGSLPPTSTRDHNPQSATRRAAISLLVLGLSVVVFTLGLWTPVSLVAAVAAGAAGLFTGSAAQTALLRHQTSASPTLASVASVASVAALWAIAWAGTKPFASLLDGWLASRIGIVPASDVLVLPAILIALMEIFLPKRVMNYIRMLMQQCVTILISSVIRSANPQKLPAKEESLHCEFCSAGISLDASYGHLETTTRGR
jgi:MFS family permease